jgi:hypothetical protein
MLIEIGESPGVSVRPSHLTSLIEIRHCEGIDSISVMACNSYVD